jgi:hypothetical protein
MPRNKLSRLISNKKAYKKSIGHCLICGDDAYEVLDVHRIQAGADGGKYKSNNTVCLCANCHRKVHGGVLQIDRWYFSTAGDVLRYIDEDGQEQFACPRS